MNNQMKNNYSNKIINYFNFKNKFYNLVNKKVVIEIMIVLKFKYNKVKKTRKIKLLLINTLKNL